MKNITSILLMSALGFSISCSTMKENTTKIDDTAVLNNPFYKKSTLQYQAPEFDKIKVEHFAPAFDYGLKVHDEEIEKITNNTAKPTFENTVLALETCGVDLSRATGVFNNLSGSNTNPTLQAIDRCPGG